MKIRSSEITPEHIYLNRRRFMTGIGALAAGATILSACGTQSGSSNSAPSNNQADTSAAAMQDDTAPQAQADTDELGDKLTPFDAVTNYNNFYEFTVQKEAVAGASEGFQTDPWTIEVGGLVNNPKTYGMEDILAKYTEQERIYRLRCVEGWSMVIPWLGFPLAELLKEVGPKSEAQFVRFETLHDPDKLPGQKSGWYEWPYIEGLRMDEAMNDLAILSTGLYGKHLLPQNGAPIRMVIPWKYGFKSIKSIVKIELVDTMPTSLWMAAAANEYGFFANVNPDVPHPRWSQATERRIGELGRRKTLPFNGYGEQVAHLYDGMDLRKFY